MLICSYPHVETNVLGAQKNLLTETVLLSTHGICFGLGLRKLIFNYTLLSRDLAMCRHMYCQKKIVIWIPMIRGVS